VEEQVRIRQAFVQLGDVEVELIEPLEGRSGYQDFLDQTGGGIHHVLFEVSDIDPVIQELAQSGVTVLQSGTGIRPGTRWALLDTRELLGFLVELRHRPGESDGASIS
jgi:methylmalonyl-CoA/ethylmalonyl-CoA epimerase